MNTRVLVNISVLLLFCTFGPVAEPSHVSHQAQSLGKVRFANSCSLQVQTEFNNAVAMLHSFQYELAEKTFQHILAHDPQCAIAYWGASMTLYHQLWDWPDADTLKKGRQYIERAKRLPIKTARERAYLNAAEAFYQPDENLQSRSRKQAYSKMICHLHESYPKDDDATAFCALSWLTLATDEDNQGNQDRAIKLLQKLFSERPEHPGAVHYLIHATDTPTLARLGLPAARTYARIAPASPHALHMPAHIFVRLGMWQESIKANLASIAAAQEATRMQRDNGSGDELHAMMYLVYSYLQAGDNASALKVVKDIKTVSGATESEIANNVAILDALYAVETHDWKQAATLHPQSVAFPYATMRTYWARAIGAARSGDIALARQSIERLDYADKSMEANMRHMNSVHAGEAEFSVQQLEARAWLDWAEGNAIKALQRMRTAVKEETQYGVESQTVPACEMLGDLLLELHEPGPALAAYTTALKEASTRLNALAGAARASRALGDLKNARIYYGMLIKCCIPMTERKEIAEAKLFLSRN